jgi:hypothetical protein
MKSGKGMGIRTIGTTNRLLGWWIGSAVEGGTILWVRGGSEYKDPRTNVLGIHIGITMKAWMPAKIARVLHFPVTIFL